MTIPIVICDDSSFARKQMTRALPEGCDFSITYAKDGSEALEALKRGLAEILFLDLNMPVLDGYQTLQAMRDAGMKSKVIVVSGDIQPDAHRRVMELGAAAFIKKPVDKVEIGEFLKKCGIKAKKAKTPRVIDIKTDIRDGCQEIANVAMGRAADLLARLLNVYILMPIPNVNTIETNELRMALKYVDQRDRVSAVCQGFIGAGIAGEALLIFDDSSWTDMAALLQYEGKIDDAVMLELLMDVSSILIGAFLRGIADQLDIKFSQGHPLVLGRHIRVSELIKRNAVRWDKTLAIETSYKFEDRNINCDLLFLFTEDSMEPLKELVSILLPD